MATGLTKIDPALRRPVVSIQGDDGRISQYTNLYPLFVERGIEHGLTINVIPSLFDTEGYITNLQAIEMHAGGMGVYLGWHAPHSGWTAENYATPADLEDALAVELAIWDALEITDLGPPLFARYPESEMDWLHLATLRKFGIRHAGIRGTGTMTNLANSNTLGKWARVASSDRMSAGYRVCDDITSGVSIMERAKGLVAGQAQHSIILHTVTGDGETESAVYDAHSATDIAAVLDYLIANGAVFLSALDYSRYMLSPNTPHSDGTVESDGKRYRSLMSRWYPVKGDGSLYTEATNWYNITNSTVYAPGASPVGECAGATRDGSVLLQGVVSGLGQRVTWNRQNRWIKVTFWGRNGAAGYRPRIIYKPYHGSVAGTEVLYPGATGVSCPDWTRFVVWIDQASAGAHGYDWAVSPRPDNSGSGGTRNCYYCQLEMWEMPAGAVAGDVDFEGDVIGSNGP